MLCPWSLFKRRHIVVYNRDASSLLFDHLFAGSHAAKKGTVEVTVYRNQPLVVGRVFCFFVPAPTATCIVYQDIE